MNGKKPQAALPRSGSEFSSSLISDLCKFWRFLLKGRALETIGLGFLMLLAAGFEMATLAAVVPLIGSLVDSHAGGATLIAGASRLPSFILNAENPQTLVLGGAILVVCTSAIVRILVIRMSADFSASLGVDLQTRYFRMLLNREYEAAINESSSENISLMTNKAQIVVSYYILGVLNSLTSIVSGIGVIIMLLWLSNSVIFYALILLVCAYLLIAFVTRTKLKSYGRDTRVYIPQKVRCVQEGLGGFRDVAMSGSQEVFVQRLNYIASKVERANARVSFYNSFPRPLLEAIGISCVAVIAWFAHTGAFANESILPTLGVFAFGMLRLLPIFQQVFGQWTKLLNGQLILADLVRDVVNTDKSEKQAEKQDTSLANGNNEKLAFSQSITVQNVGFSYHGERQPALKDLNFSISKGEYIGIVGPTGSGKSTLVDILMGLLPPTSGHLIIDDVPLSTAYRKLWRRQVAHVPQKIYLSEGSLTSNIAFAVNENDVDQQHVVECARKACVHDFIQGLTSGYDTPVGEDGVRLSGGQRQRIGIARALYSGCRVLIFDEATNALDDTTEKAVIDELLKPEQNYTIVSITHNLNSVQHCHRILQIEAGSAGWLSE